MPDFDSKVLKTDVDSLIRRMESDGYMTMEGLNENDVLIVHAGGQDIELSVVKQGSDEIMVTSNGAWGITPYLTDDWGTTLHPWGLSMWPHRLSVGNRLILGVVYTPPVERITLRKAGEEATIPLTDE